MAGVCCSVTSVRCNSRACWSRSTAIHASPGHCWGEHLGQSRSWSQSTRPYLRLVRT
jgi:hypothetical protein